MIIILLSSIPMFFCICIRRRAKSAQIIEKDSTQNAYTTRADALSIFFEWWLSTVGVGFPSEVPIIWAVIHRCWCFVMIVLSVFRICAYFSWVPLFSYDNLENFRVVNETLVFALFGCSFIFFYLAQSISIWKIMNAQVHGKDMLLCGIIKTVFQKKM